MSSDRPEVPETVAEAPSRREFLKRAVAVGGAASLAACLDRVGVPEVPTGPDDLSALPTRQHAWNDVLARDDHGNARQPRHHALLLLDYVGDGPAADRSTVESAFRSLERAYRRGPDGLLFTVGYAPRYFERFDAAPAGVDLPEPRALAPFEDPDLDRPDALVHLASDHAAVTLTAEEALLGRRDAANGVETAADLGGVFETADRRSGFVGAGLPAEHDDVAGVPDGAVDEDAPLYMGFKSGFEKNQASEDRITIRSGPFAGGTTGHLSRIRLHLDQWYEQDSRSQRVSKMFCPAHADEGRVEGVGENLGDGSGVEDCDDAAETARERGIVGHTQKSRDAREDDAPVILRRDFDSTDGDRAGLHFLSLQRAIEEFVATREAMNGTDLAADSGVGTRTNNGILRYMTVTRRGNYLLPPRERRALPAP